MPVNGNSVGTDVSIRIVVNGRNFRIAPNFITSFTPTPVTTDEQRHGLDGVRRTAVFPMGWDLAMQIDRGGSELEDLWASIEEAYYAGQNIGAGTITETIIEPAGGVSQWRYTNVSFKLTALGDRAAGQIIKQSIEAYASQRVKVN